MQGCPIFALQNDPRGLAADPGIAPDWQRCAFWQVAESGLKVQAVMSFHAAGGNVGDTCKISLPKWVQAVGEEDPDIYYTDRAGTRNKECLSLGCDEQPIFFGRTPVDLYRGFIEAFADNFEYLFGE
jgi:beta-amylase